VCLCVLNLCEYAHKSTRCTFSMKWQGKETWSIQEDNKKHADM
jgi:hypothetical protein